MEYCIQYGITAGLDQTDIRRAVEEVLAEQRGSTHAGELEYYADLEGSALLGATRL
jgi:hypothetical protein